MSATAPNFSLAHLTVLSLPPPAMIEVAARTGYRAVGLRLIAATDDSPAYPLMTDGPAMRDTRARLAATGIRVNDIEFVKITPEIEVERLEPFVAAGAELGAGQVVAAPYDPDLSRLADRLGALADLARPHGLGVVLEFFPWTVVADVGAARKAVEAAGRPNLGILVDTLHFARSASTLDDLAALPAGLLPLGHLADAPAGDRFTTEQLLHTARAERLPPGEGGLPLAGILRSLPPGIPLGLEVPMAAATAALGPEAVARRVREAATRLLARLAEEP